MPSARLEAGRQLAPRQIVDTLKSKSGTPVVLILEHDPATVAMLQAQVSNSFAMKK
jgi:hypothetical protein